MTDTFGRELGDNLFGDGNLGEAFDQFPVQHKCNKYCEWFELGKPQAFKENASASKKKKTKASKGKKSVNSPRLSGCLL
jgi:hypothetical protein